MKSNLTSKSNAAQRVDIFTGTGNMFMFSQSVTTKRLSPKTYPAPVKISTLQAEFKSRD